MQVGCLQLPRIVTYAMPVQAANTGNFIKGIKMRAGIVYLCSKHMQSYCHK